MNSASLNFIPADKAVEGASKDEAADSDDASPKEKSQRGPK
jgi:hypothetical protein